MALSFYYKFGAPAGKTAEALEQFFKTLEVDARRLGFTPTLVVNAWFDSPERRRFARQLTSGLPLENDRFKGDVPVDETQVFSHDPATGMCRVIPEQGVFLVVTNEQREETVLGMFRYPEFIRDSNGRNIAPTNAGADWRFEDFVDSPDPRFRVLVRKIADAGFLREAVDEYAQGNNPFNLTTS